MEVKQEKINWYGLLGKDIEYSFSRAYFSEKFKKQQLLNCRYLNFDIDDISLFTKVLEQYPNLKGFNVTIPYKQAIIPYLNDLTETAIEIGAVNCVKVTNQGLTGHNTDVYGFQKAIEKMLKPHHTKALVLGTGGASKAVAFALKKMGFIFKLVSRNPQEGSLSYVDLNETHLSEFQIIINTTPLGTYPNLKDCPPIPYQFITDNHLVMDLIYNPKKTKLLEIAESKRATILNGLEMLTLQAEKSWDIWNE